MSGINVIDVILNTEGHLFYIKAGYDQDKLLRKYIK